MLAWLNGEILPEEEAVISIQDDGVKFGRGLFETIRIYQGWPFRLSAHLDRMYHSAQILDFLPDYLPELLKNQALELIQQNRVENGILRIHCSGGNSLWLTTSAQIPYRAEQQKAGFSAMISAIKRNETSPLVSHKTFNYLDNILAKKTAGSLGYQEALFLNTQNLLAEGAVSNVFLVKNRKLITPDLLSGILPGIARSTVLDLAGPLMEVEERTVQPDELHSAEECFLTNSLMEIMPLVKVDASFVGNGQPGQITRELMELYRKRVLEEVKSPY